jgi:hypothetical protein
MYESNQPRITPPCVYTGHSASAGVTGCAKYGRTEDVLGVLEGLPSNCRDASRGANMKANSHSEPTKKQTSTIMNR